MREQGDLDGALLHIQSVLKVADHWGALMQLGQLYRAKDDATAAIAAFRRAAAMIPTQAASARRTRKGNLGIRGFERGRAAHRPRVGSATEPSWCSSNLC